MSVRVELYYKSLAPVRLALQRNSINYSSLVDSARDGFKLNPKTKLAFTYQDEEGDNITATSDGDIAEALMMCSDILKLSISENTKDDGFEVINPTPAEEKQQVPSKADPASHPLLKKLLGEFVSHETLPDRVKIAASGSVATKSWKVKNIGAVAWPEGVTVSFVSGDESLRARGFILESVAPDAEAVVSIDVVIPNAPGRYTAFYRLSVKGDQYFGPWLWMDVEVTSKAAAVAVDDGKQAPVASAHDEDAECPQTFGKYNAAMLQLWKMGYRDCGLNLYLLDKKNGDVQSVVLYMLDHYPGIYPSPKK